MIFGMTEIGHFFGVLTNIMLGFQRGSVYYSEPKQRPKKYFWYDHNSITCAISGQKTAKMSTF